MDWFELLDNYDNRTLEKIIEDCREQIEKNPNEHYRIGKWNLMIKKCENELAIQSTLGVY